MIPAQRDILNGAAVLLWCSMPGTELPCMSKGQHMPFAAALSSPHPHDLRSAGRQGFKVNLPQAANLHLPIDDPTSAIKSSSVTCRTPLDVMRIDMSSGEHRYAVCVASYGYMGDLMRTSERLRFLGPSRYGLAGAWTLLRGAAYEAKVGSLLLFESSAVIGFALGELCLRGVPVQATAAWSS